MSKLDKDFSFIYECPETSGELTEQQVYCSESICPLCGMSSKTSKIHHNVIAGKWLRYSWYEVFFKGKQNRFISKDNLRKSHD